MDQDIIEQIEDILKYLSSCDFSDDDMLIIRQAVKCLNDTVGIIKPLILASNINEKITYEWSCPVCESCNHGVIKPQDTDYYTCSKCNKKIKIENDIFGPF